VDLEGRVVGINTAGVGAGAAENIGFAIAINRARPVIEHAIEDPEGPEPLLGVSTQAVTPALAAQFGRWLNQVSPPYEELPASEFLSVVEQAPDGGRINFVVEGVDLMGDDVRKTVNVPLGEPAEPLERLRRIGLTVTPAGDTLMITNVNFGSYAKRIGLDVGYDVTAVLKKADQPSSLIPIGAALAVTALIAGLQLARKRAAARESHAA
jgi:hypothetical protein